MKTFSEECLRISRGLAPEVVREGKQTKIGLRFQRAQEPLMLGFYRECGIWEPVPNFVERIAEVALRARRSARACGGGLMAFGDRLFDSFQRSTVLRGQNFQGAKPTDLPVEQPMQFYLTINPKSQGAWHHDPAHAACAR
jgi:hypothetical protein